MRRSFDLQSEAQISVDGQMFARSKLLKQFKTLLPALFTTYIPGLFVLFMLGIMKLWAGIPIKALTDDPSAYMKVPAYVGLLSNLGVLVWSASVVICLFTYVLLRKGKNAGDLPSFLLYSGLITAVLVLDDFFLLHETLILSFHVPEVLVFAGYIIAISPYPLKFRRTISKTDFLFLFFAFAFFGLSMAVDVSGIHPRGGTLLEEGSKFLGIISLFAYYSRVCFQLLLNGLFLLEYRASGQADR